MIASYYTGSSNQPKVIRTTAITILSAGDQNEELEMLFRHLGEDHRLLTARSEKAVIKMLERQSIQLIISNFGAFNGRGAEFCAELKASESYSDIPVILLIDEISMLSRMKCLQSGADAYIERPFSGRLLKAHIRNILTNRERIKDRFVFSVVADTAPTQVCTGKKKFLDLLNELIVENLGKKDLNAAFLARTMNMSRPTLYRKVKCVSDLTINELINISRLNRAAVLLSTGDNKIADVARMAGFQSRRNFGKAFLRHFSLTPSAFQQLKKAL